MDRADWARHDAGFLPSDDPRDVNVRNVEALKEMRKKNQHGLPPLQDPWGVESAEVMRLLTRRPTHHSSSSFAKP